MRHRGQRGLLSHRARRTRTSTLGTLAAAVVVLALAAPAAADPTDSPSPSPSATSSGVATPTPTATPSGSPTITTRGLPAGFAGQLVALQDQASTLQANLQAAGTAASTAIAAYTATTDQVQAAVTAAAQAQTALDAANVSVAAAKRAVQLVIATAYTQRIPHTSAALLLSANYDDLQFNVAALEYLADRNNDEFARLRSAQATAAGLATRQQTALTAAQTLQATANTQRDSALTALGEVASQQAGFLTAVATLRDTAATSAAAAPLSPADQTTYAAFLAQLSTLETQARTAATTYVTGGPGLTPLAGTSWVRPMTTYTESSCYCMRGAEFHHGVDLAAPFGTPIYAVGAGTVVAAGPAQGFGNWVVVDHHDGSFSIYGHMRVLATVVGTEVGPGTLLAYVGSEGESSGPHLHFEVRLGSYASAASSTDPVLWLAQRGVTL